MADLDPHGQPYNLAFNRARRTERDLSEMLGLAKGLLADGVVTDEEAQFLRGWSESHPDAIDKWPINLICSRLQQFFADGRIDESERHELKELLAHLVGGTASILLGYDAATTLPLDMPPPLMCWESENFVFTGQFAFGTRRDCAREVLERGGFVDEHVTKLTTFLVIGTFGSRDWAHTSYGRKIQQAVKYRDAGLPLRIVGEDHWANALNASPV